MLRNKLLNEARITLLDPEFRKLTTQQMQDTFRRYIAEGLTKQDLINIITGSSTESQSTISVSKLEQLEKLPRVVFKQLIETGKIKGKDLIYLCNSSPLLRSYCLADSTDINGQVLQSQEIYRIALRNMGVEIGPNDNPSEAYLRIVSEVYNLIELDKSMVYDNLSDKYVAKNLISTKFRNIRDFISSENVDIVLDENRTVTIIYKGTQLVSSKKLTELPKIKAICLASDQDALGMLDINGNLIVLGNSIISRGYPKLKHLNVINPSNEFEIAIFDGMDSFAKIKKVVQFKKIASHPTGFLLLDNEDDLYEFTAYNPNVLNLIANNVQVFSELNDGKLLLRKNDGNLLLFTSNSRKGVQFNIFRMFAAIPNSVPIMKFIIFRGHRFSLSKQGFLVDFENNRNIASDIIDFGFYQQDIFYQLYAVKRDGTVVTIYLENQPFVEFARGDYYGEQRIVPGLSRVRKIITTTEGKIYFLTY